MFGTVAQRLEQRAQKFIINCVLDCEVLCDSCCKLECTSEALYQSETAFGWKEIEYPVGNFFDLDRCGEKQVRISFSYSRILNIGHLIGLRALSFLSNHVLVEQYKIGGLGFCSKQNSIEFVYQITVFHKQRKLWFYS